MFNYLLKLNYEVCLNFGSVMHTGTEGQCVEESGDEGVSQRSRLGHIPEAHHHMCKRSWQSGCLKKRRAASEDIRSQPWENSRGHTGSQWGQTYRDLPRPASPPSEWPSGLSSPFRGAR